MLLRPNREDFRLIGFYTGKVLTGVGLAMLVPLGMALALGDIDNAFGFLIGASLAISVGRCTDLFLRTQAHLSPSNGLATAALTWLVAPVFAAVPLLLSGHYASYLDAYFEAMSGFATIGLTLANDLDHMARSVNFWRHFMQFMGGQGIIVVMLTIFASSAVRVGALYTGEGREEKILPNVIRTARFIWRVALAYALVGMTALWLAITQGGMEPGRAAFHAVTLFMAAFDTGGFAVHSSSLAYYRSPLVEAICTVVAVAGAFSFALHYQLWQGRRFELTRNIETRTLVLTLAGAFVVLAIGLGRTGTFTEFWPLFRHGFFQTVSAHTTTGLATVPGRLFVTDWGAMAPGMIVGAMALGGMAGSTAGGIKAIRIGVILKGLRSDIRRVLMPEDAELVETYHSTTLRILRGDQVGGAATILLLYMLLYLAAGMLGLFYGYDLQTSLFESTAAASSGGLSVGIVRPELEWPLKVTYIAQMVIGRLEFIPVFALFGYLVATMRGRA